MLKDKTILVTGAGDGIGKAVAIKYAALGANTTGIDLAASTISAS